MALGTMEELAKSLFPGVWVEIEFLQMLAEDMVEAIKGATGYSTVKAGGKRSAYPGGRQAGNIRYHLAPFFN